MYLERESNPPHHRYVKTRRYRYIIKVVSMWITLSCRAIDNLFLHLFPQMVTIHPSHFKRVLPTPVCYRGVFKSLRLHRLLYLIIVGKIGFEPTPSPFQAEASTN